MLKIDFLCETNSDKCMINTAVFTMPNGTRLTIDRTETEYSFGEYGHMHMTWKNCYLWAINDCCIFGDRLAYLDIERDLSELLCGSTLEFELEDDAFLDCPDYKVKCISYTI